MNQGTDVKPSSGLCSRTDVRHTSPHVLRLSRMRYSLLTTAIVVCLGCNRQPPADTLSGPDATRQAEVAFKALGGQLKSELGKAIGAGGPVAAVEVCKHRAPAIAAKVREQLGFAVGRSSHRLRNPSNTPAPGGPVETYLQKYAGKNATDLPTETTLHNGAWTVVAPIETQPLCLNCHGNKATFTHSLQSTLNTYYTEDEATGFSQGELRGVFWATVPQKRPN